MDSAQVTKSSNAGFDPRELQRRKFQEAAAQAIDRQAAAIQQTREYMADLSERLDLFRQRIEDMRESMINGMKNHDQRLIAFEHGSLWTRLRWLLTGR